MRTKMACNNSFSVDGVCITRIVKDGREKGFDYTERIACRGCIKKLHKAVLKAMKQADSKSYQKDSDSLIRPKEGEK